jgi:hypothetical protein
MDHDILNLDNVPLFIEKQWIKAGKQYPKDDTPYEVLWAREDILKIPDLHLKLLPAPNLPVAQFLQHELLPQSAEIIMTTVQSWFTPDTPIMDTKSLLNRPIPPIPTMGSDILEETFGGMMIILNQETQTKYYKRVPYGITQVRGRLQGGTECQDLVKGRGV